MRKLTVAATLLAVLFAAGCVQDPGDTELTDEESIRLVLAESGMARMEPLDGRGEDDGGKWWPGPERWWRELTAEGQLEVILENDPATGVCTVTVVRTLQGVLNIDVVHDGVLDPGVKQILDTRTRRAVLERQGETTDPRRGWVLTHLTPAEYALSPGAPVDQEVLVQSMSLYEGDQLVWECDSRETFYPVDGGLPVLVPGEQVRLEAEVIHTNPQYEPDMYVYAHGPCPTWPRHFMNDDGLYGDRVAGDGVYSYEWYVEGSSEWWYVAVDVIDADTMMDQEEEDYDSGAWGIVALKEEV